MKKSNASFEAAQGTAVTLRVTGMATWALALMLALGFSLGGCGGDTISSVDNGDLAAYLDGLPANSSAEPHTVKLSSSITIDTSDTSAGGVWANVNNLVQNARKYVILDLSRCSAAGNMVAGAASPTGNKLNIIQGNDYIKGIILPDRLTSIGEAAFFECGALASVSIPARIGS
jgi:hypothetical protein